MQDANDERKPIGKTSSPSREPNTTLTFSCWLQEGVRLNPFDFIVAEQSDKSITIAMVDEIFAYTDSESHLTNYIGNYIGDPNIQPYVDRVSAMVARANVLTNVRHSDNEEELYMPLPADMKVFYADENDIGRALGFDGLENDRKIPAGLIPQSSGERFPIYLDANYVIGPEAGHVNVTGISGLAAKTSFAMFLIQSMQQTLDDVAVIIFNVKHSDLLHIDEGADDLRPIDTEMYKALGLETKPFDNVKYFLPRGQNGEPESDDPPSDHQIYAYRLEDIYGNLDLLLCDADDPYFTIDAFTNFMRLNWDRSRNSIRFHGHGRNANNPVDVRTWDNLFDLDNEYIGQTVYHQAQHATPPRLKRDLRRLTSHSYFVNQRSSNEVYLGKAIRDNIKPGQVSVIDIYRIHSSVQPFIIGDVMRNIESYYHATTLTQTPRIIIFIDELNTFAPSKDRPDTITQQIVEIASKGRGRGTALFGAQQFKSKVYREVWGNCSVHAIGRVGSAELGTAPYGQLSSLSKNMVMNLRQGEMLLSFQNWRNPVKVVFPMPSYKRPSKNKRQLNK